MKWREWQLPYDRDIGPYAGAEFAMQFVSPDLLTQSQLNAIALLQLLRFFVSQAAQNQALTSVAVLGNKVGITYGSNLSGDQ